MSRSSVCAKSLFADPAFFDFALSRVRGMSGIRHLPNRLWQQLIPALSAALARRAVTNSFTDDDC